MKEFESKIGCI